MDEIEETQKKINSLTMQNTVTDPRDLCDEDQERFNALVVKSKKCVGEGRIEDALKLNKKALTLCYNEKLAKKIKKMEEYLKEREEESDDDTGMTHLGKGFYLYKDLHDKLYVHQQEGVLWLWSLYRLRKGGLLGDDMGLGKTIQVIAFLSGMFDMQKITSVLIVLPVALMMNWENELKKWAPGLKVVAFHGNSKREKERALARVQRRGGICLTTYGLVVTSWEQLGTQDGREFAWDYMILDEGHKIKNPTKTSKGVHAIPATNRIILTGTPVQNNLKELWALFDFVHQGSLLGTQRTFKMEYDNPITRAREKDATSNEKKLGMEMAQSLKEIISPYFLRRTKAEVKEREKHDTNKGEDKKKAKHAVMPTMTRKNDLIVWTFLGQAQLQIYQDFLHLDTVKELLMTSRSPLVALNVLKKICDHPRLLSTKACSQLGIEGDEGLDDEMLETEAGNLSAVTRIQHVADHILISESGKLVFLIKLLDQLKVEGHRCLVFSQSRKMLDIMQKILTNKGHKIMRLDGTITQIQEREQRIKKFQTDDSYSVFLLTTQVGGVGLTLTAADRVVIYDPSWNPATDAQAVDRVFRIGQNKNVVIYRLITCGTVEEKIYRRQVFKDSITRQTTGNSKNPTRYFSKYELRELFTLNDPTMSTTQQQLEEMHSGERLTDPSLDEHIAFLYSLEMFGLSDHDLMFTQGTGRSADDMSDDDLEVDQATENDYIQHRVQKAKQLLQMESQQEMQLEERQGKNQGPNAPNVPRNHMWDFPNAARNMVEEEQSDKVETTCISSGEEEDNEEPVPKINGDLTVDLTSPEPSRNILPKIKAEPITDMIDLTTPLIKQEEHSNSEEERMEIGDTQKKRQYNTPDKQQYNTPDKRDNMDYTHDDEEMNDYDSDKVHGDGSPSLKFNDRHEDSEGHTSTSKPVTPLSRTVRESLIISPEPSKPLMQTEPVTHRSPSEHSSPFVRKLNSTLFQSDQSPDGDRLNHETDNSYRASIGESPSLNVSHSRRNPIVEDSPDRSRISQGSGGSRYGSSVAADDERDSVNDSMVDNSVINDSIVSEPDEMEHSHHGDISVHDVKGILERSLVTVNNPNDDEMLDTSDIVPSRRPMNSRRSISARRPVIESSDEDEADNSDDITDNGDNHLEEVDNSDSDNDQYDHVDDDDNNDSINGDDNANENHSDNNDNTSCNDISKSAEDDMNESRLNDMRNTSNLIDRSVNGLDKHYKENSRKSHENGHDSEISGQLTDKRHRQSTENNREQDNHDDENVETEELSGESEGDEEEEEDEYEDFEALPEELQIKYNELVETGRSLCQQRLYEEGQVHVLQALEIYPDPELQATAMMIQKKIVKKQMKDALNAKS